MKNNTLIIVDDLHLEGRDEIARNHFKEEIFKEINKIKTTNDNPILVCAGDISEGLNGINWVRDFDCDIVYVCGNHEFWHGDYYQTISDIKAKTSEKGFTHIRFLNNEITVINNTKFIGATLWTDLGQEWPWIKKNFIVNHFAAMADFKQITARQFYRNSNNIAKMTEFLTENGIDNAEITNLIAEERFNPYIEIEEHKKSLDFIENSLIEGFDGDTVVVTHHLPTPDFWMKKFGMKENVLLAPYINNRGIYQEYQKRKIPPEKDVLMMGFYVNTLTHLFDHNLSPDVWIHGHFHKPVDGYIGSTHIVSSPVGYVRQGNEFRCKIINLEDKVATFARNQQESINEYEWGEKIVDNLEEFERAIKETTNSIQNKTMSIEVADSIVKMYKKQHEKNIKDLEQYVSSLLYDLIKIRRKEENIADQLYITSYISGFAKWASKNGRIGLDPLVIPVTENSFLNDGAYKKLKEKIKGEHYTQWLEDIYKIKDQIELFKKTLVEYFHQLENTSQDN